MPTMSRFFTAASLPVLTVFCPFAVGYFLSFFFRNVNAIISKDLAGEFALTPADLGCLTSMYLLAFAAFAAGVQTGLPALLAVYSFTGIFAALAYALLTPLFSPEITGRGSTASNMLLFALS